MSCIHDLLPSTSNKKAENINGSQFNRWNFDDVGYNMFVENKSRKNNLWIFEISRDIGIWYVIEQTSTYVLQEILKDVPQMWVQKEF